MHPESYVSRFQQVPVGSWICRPCRNSLVMLSVGSYIGSINIMLQVCNLSMNASTSCLFMNRLYVSLTWKLQTQRLCERFPTSHFMGKHRFRYVTETWNQFYSYNDLHVNVKQTVIWICLDVMQYWISHLIPLFGIHSLDIAYIRLLCQDCCEEGRYWYSRFIALYYIVSVFSSWIHRMCEFKAIFSF
jgi:hypothetical protein